MLTADGRALLPFHGNLLQAAIAADAPAQPVAVSFFDAASGAPSHAPCWPGNESLLRAVWRTLAAAPLLVRVRFGAPRHAMGHDRRSWALSLREEVDALLHDGAAACNHL